MRRCCEETMRVLRLNKEALLTLIQVPLPTSPLKGTLPRGSLNPFTMSQQVTAGVRCHISGSLFCGCSGTKSTVGFELLTYGVRYDVLKGEVVVGHADTRGPQRQPGGGQ